MACLYTGEFVFLAYLGLKKAPIQSGMAFVPLIVTGFFHRILIRKLIVPIRKVSLEVAAEVDLLDGELPMDGIGAKQYYRQPALDPDKDERAPMPYRRKSVASAKAQEEPV